MTKSQVMIDTLLENGFRKVGFWKHDHDNRISLEADLPSLPGVYCFCVSGIAHYCGVAQRDLKKRLYFYQRPGISQRTNVRLNALIASKLNESESVEVVIATPPDLEWQGWMIAGASGLEAGLIRQHHFPWNVLGSSEPSLAKPTFPAQSGAVVSKAATRLGGKYGPLRSFLEQNQKDIISMSFGQIEALVGSLPKSAYLHQAWWGNHEGNSQAKSWMGAKYLVEANPARRSVIFRRFTY